MSRRALAVAVAAMLMAPLGVWAQESVSLEGVEELARLGRSQEARLALSQWWENDRADAPRRDLQRALWLRGSLTVDPGQAALDYRRLVIEFPGGPFSDQALLRLAQAAHASGDGESARAHVGTLRRDYPSSPVRREAEAWLNAAGPAPTPPRQPEAEEEEAAAVPPAAPPDPSAESEADGPRFSVQLGAFAEEERARFLYERAVADGLDARIVRLASTRLHHVRVGLFDSVDPARELVMRLGGAGYVAALVRDANIEERNRR